jgi:AraC-like DNA-binding protein
MVTMPRVTPADTGLLLYMLDYSKDKNTTAITNRENIHIPYWTHCMDFSHNHVDHEINIIIKGVGHYTYGPDKKTISVHSGQILFIPSGCEHSLSGADNFITLHGFYIHPSVFARLSNVMQPTPLVRKLATGHDSSIPVRWTDDNHVFRSMQEIYEQCLAEYARNNEWRVPLFNAVSQLLSVMVVRLLNTKSVDLSSDSTMMRLLNTRGWIDRHFLDHITISDLAQKTSLSRAHFSELFTNLTGVSPKKYIIGLRLNQAMALLEETDLSITDISIRTGFTHLAHFDRLFHDITGMSPNKYRIKKQSDKKS